MNYEKSIIQINVRKIDIDLNHPLNLYKNYETSGTGFFIDEKLILTCYHVIQGSVDINISILQNELKVETKATIKHIFPDDDLAIIEIDLNDLDYMLLKYSIITNKNILSDTDANTIGYPNGSKNLIINKGVISGFQDSLIQTDSPLNSGNSGGPLIINNNVVGISQSKLGNASNVGFAIPIYRFLIYWKLKRDELKLINNKPNLYFKYQVIKQKDKHLCKNGVLLTSIHINSVLKNTNISVGDYLLEICDHKIDYDGFVKFSFYPEKIELKHVYRWFTDNDTLKIKYLSNKTNKIIVEETKFKVVQTNLITYYPELNQKYYYENNGLIISIISDYHIERFADLDLNLKQKIKILSRCLDYKNKFTVYLADVDLSKLKFQYYPTGDIIIEINDKIFNDYNSFTKIISEPLVKIKTINNEIFYV